MNITPTHISIGRLFEQNFLFEVPKYQRYYAWDDEQVTDFIKDIKAILDNAVQGRAIEHFFGGIVCASKTVEGSTRQQKELIDGQQRITTTLLLIHNVIKAYNTLLQSDSLEQSDRDTIKARITKLSEKYFIYQDEINRRPQTVPKLVLSVADNEYYNSLINSLGLRETRDSHKRLHKADNLLAQFIKTELDSCASDSDKIDFLHRVDLIISTSCTVIFMDCDSRDSAYRLFQVLNDRGAGLTEGDLLKSRTLEALEHYPDQQQRALTFWDEILKDDPKQVENFLRTFYASFCGKRAGRTSLYDDFIGQFFPELAITLDINDEHSANEIVNFINNLLSEVQLFRKIIGGEWPFFIEQPITLWDASRLNVLTNFLSYDITMPFLLAAVKLGAKQYAEIVHKLEKFMFRYKTICGNGHQNISEIFMEEAKSIRTNPSAYRINSLYTKLRELLTEKANDSIFIARLSNLRYTPNGGNKTLRYFFCTLSEYYQWSEHGGRRKPYPKKETTNFDDVTIDHVYAQNSQYPNPGFGDSEIHKLFNLTILSHFDNEQRAKNKTFQEKQPVYRESYDINHKLASFENWTPLEADQWRQYLEQLAIKVFVI